MPAQVQVAAVRRDGGRTGRAAGPARRRAAVDARAGQQRAAVARRAAARPGGAAVGARDGRKGPDGAGRGQPPVDRHQRADRRATDGPQGQREAADRRNRPAGGGQAARARRTRKRQGTPVSGPLPLRVTGWGWGKARGGRRFGPETDVSRGQLSFYSVLSVPRTSGPLTIPS